MGKIVTAVRNLQRRNARRRLSTVVLEGTRLVEEALRAQVPLEGALIAEDTLGSRGVQVASALAHQGVPIERVAAKELESLSDTDTPQGLIVLARPRGFSSVDVKPEDHRPALVLDGLNDPGNVGTLIRTALGLGSAGVFLLPGTAGLSHPKVLRAAMGATFVLPCLHIQLEELDMWLKATRASLMVAETDGVDVATVDWTGHNAIVIGDEASGASEAIITRASHRVGIPIQPGVESLNAAIAGGIMLYEACRT